MLIKAVFFDLDGTLYDRRRAQRELVRMIVFEFADLFRGLDEETVTRAFLDSEELAFQEFNAGASIEATRIDRSRRFLQTLGLPEKYSEAITGTYLRHYPAVNIPIDGACRVVVEVARKFQIGVISNGSPDVQRHKLKGLALADMLGCIIVSDEVGVRKPDAAIFLRAAGCLGRRPSECLHVGDSYDTDVVGARNAGMLACWFNPTKSQLRRGAEKPDFEIASLHEILQVLE